MRDRERPGLAAAQVIEQRRPRRRRRGVDEHLEQGRVIGGELVEVDATRSATASTIRSSRSAASAASRSRREDVEATIARWNAASAATAARASPAFAASVMLVTAACSHTSSAGRRAHQRLEPGELQGPARRVEIADVLDRQPRDLDPAVQRVDDQPLALELTPARPARGSARTPSRCITSTSDERATRAGTRRPAARRAAPPRRRRRASDRSSGSSVMSRSRSRWVAVRTRRPDPRSAHGPAPAGQRRGTGCRRPHRARRGAARHGAGVWDHETML